MRAPPAGRASNAFSDEHLLRRQIPVVQDVAHRHHVRLRQIVIEEAARGETQADRQARRRWAYSSKMGATAGRSKPIPLQLRIRECNLDGQIALRGADIGEGAVLAPRELPRHRDVGAAAEAGHCRQKQLQSRRIRIEAFEQPGRAALHLVLRQAGPERLGEVAPERIEPLIRHLEKAAQVGRLPAIEEQIRVRGVAIAVAVTLQETERHQRVQEVARRSSDGGRVVRAGTRSPPVRSQAR